jgi:hypothetical protein
VNISEDDVMTEGEIWKVKGLLHFDEFEVAFSDWDSINPEQKARTFYEEQTFLVNTSLTRERVIRLLPEVVESKDGPESRESEQDDGGPMP